MKRNGRLLVGVVLILGAVTLGIAGILALSQAWLGVILLVAALLAVVAGVWILTGRFTNRSAKAS